jgi:hypothetical protein
MIPGSGGAFSDYVPDYVSAHTRICAVCVEHGSGKFFAKTVVVDIFLTTE